MQPQSQIQVQRFRFHHKQRLMRTEDFQNQPGIHAAADAVHRQMTVVECQPRQIGPGGYTRDGCMPQPAPPPVALPKTETGAAVPRHSRFDRIRHAHGLNRIGRCRVRFPQRLQIRCQQLLTGPVTGLPKKLFF